MDSARRNTRVFFRSGRFPGKRANVSAAAAVLLLSALLFAEAPAAQPPTGQPGTASEAQSVDLLDTLEKAYAAESDGLKELGQERAQLDLLLKTASTEINAYKIQNAAHGNLLLLPSASVKDLEKALSENRAVRNAVDERLKHFNERSRQITQILQQTNAQIEMGQRQAKEVRSGRWKRAEKTALLSAVGKLSALLVEKRKVLQSLHERLKAAIADLEGVETALARTSERLKAQIQEQAKAQLFERDILLLKALKGKEIASEIRKTAAEFGKLLDGTFWAEQSAMAVEAGAMPLITLAVFILLGGLVFYRIRALCRRYEALPAIRGYPWRSFCLALLCRSILLTGAALVLFAYDTLQFPHFRVTAVRFIFHIVLILLMARWGFDFLRLWQPGEGSWFPARTAPRIRSLLVFVRLLSILYLLFLWAVGSGGIVLFGIRLILEIGLVAWCITFWRAFRMARQDVAAGHLTPLQSLAMAACYLVAVGGLIIEVAGYPSLSVYWYVSLAKTAAVVFWAAILFLVIREWHRGHRSAVSDDEPLSAAAGHPLHLVFIQVAWLLWVLALFDGLVLAWSTNWEVFQAVYGFMSRPWAIGKINLSIVGLLYAFIALFFTYSLTRLGRYILTEKILTERAIEPGLKASITTITVYLLWALGIIMALGVLGVSATSLAVVFGALSIGIGFGLQNIFNNFISGIILLFERPIQEGDAIEVGGVWAEVKKINVRATVVQTYDNASLIIPNSELISSQVTNWSFKDKRMRRRINIGVAYGSDVELVRKTLLEIADQARNVLKYPRPDVLFMDHGDSALIFTLRYWTTVDYFYSTSTDIRFEIDRRFRELEIEIAFPQRDLHIRSVAGDTRVDIGGRTAAGEEDSP